MRKIFIISFILFLVVKINSTSEQTTNKTTYNQHQVI